MMTHAEKRDRGLTICQMLADGKTRKQIAEHMGRTRATVDQSIATMIQKHNVTTETGLISKLMREGIIV